MACPEPWHHTLQVKGYVSDHIRWLRGSFNHCLQSVHLQYFVLGQTCPNCHSPERGFCCPIPSSKIDRTCHYCSIPLKDSNSETQHCLGPSNLLNRRGFTWGWPNRHKSPRNQRKKRQELPRHQRLPRSLELIFCCRWYYICILCIYIYYCYILLILLLLLYYYCYFLFVFIIYCYHVCYCYYRYHYHNVSRFVFIILFLVLLLLLLVLLLFLFLSLLLLLLLLCLFLLLLLLLLLLLVLAC
jgi:hypothetical protein